MPILFHSGGKYNPYSDVLQVEKIACKHPELKLICCHCFYPNLEKCKLLMEYPNVFWGLSSIADDESRISDVAEIVSQLIATAPDRVLFGSDYSCCSQKQHIEFVKGLRLDKNIEEAVFWKNAEKIYSL